MLIFGKKLTAGEALAQGLVTEVFPDNVFQEEVWARLRAHSKLPPNVSVCLCFRGEELRVPGGGGGDGEGGS